MPEPVASDNFLVGSGVNSAGIIQSGPSPAIKSSGEIANIIPSANSNATNINTQFISQNLSYSGADDAKDLYSEIAKLANFTKCDASSMDTR